MMESLRWPRPTPAAVHTPDPSGPLWIMASVISRTRAGSTGLAVSRWKIPAIPHMGSSPYAVSQMGGTAFGGIAAISLHSRPALRSASCSIAPSSRQHALLPGCAVTSDERLVGKDFFCPFSFRFSRVNYKKFSLDFFFLFFLYYFFIIFF